MKTKKVIKVFFFFALLALVVEMTAKNLEKILPLEIQQRYADINFYGNSYITNGRGARGTWSRDGKVQIAIIGSSILAMNGLPDLQTWTTRLEQDRAFNIHIDNYGVGYTKTGTAQEILEYIQRSGFHYDIIIINLTLEKTNPGRHLYLSSTYHSRWVQSRYASCATCELLKSFWQRRANHEKVHWTFIDDITVLAKAYAQAPLAPNAFKNDSIYDRELYREARLTGKTAPQAPYPYGEFILQKTADTIAKLFKTALAITPNVIWIGEGIAYHERMLPSYLDKYTWLLPHRDWEKSGLYVDAATMNRRFVDLNEFTRTVLMDLPVREIRLDLEMQEKITHMEDLYMDEFHLTSRGSWEVYRVLKPKLLAILEDIQNQNRK